MWRTFAASTKVTTPSGGGRSVPCSGGCHRLPDQVRRQVRRLVAEEGVDPRARPGVADVLSVRPTRDPARMCLRRKEHDASARRYKLRRADLLPRVVAVGERQCSRVGAVGEVPEHFTGHPPTGAPSRRGSSGLLRTAPGCGARPRPSCWRHRWRGTPRRVLHGVHRGERGRPLGRPR